MDACACVDTGWLLTEGEEDGWSTVQEQVSIGVTNLSKKYVKLLNYLRVVVDEPGGFGRKDNLDEAASEYASKLFTLRLVFASARRGSIQA